MDNQQLAKIHELCDYTLEGKWKKVIEIYLNHPSTQTTKITTSEDTALHIAVKHGQTEFVAKLVEEFMKIEQRGPRQSEPETREKSREQDEGTNEINMVQETKAMKMKNTRGDTPLHLAAICRIIAEKDGDLLVSRNHKGETPIFLAALNWHRDAFLCHNKMHSRHGKLVELHTLRRDNGDTILHCAIKREHFGQH